MMTTHRVTNLRRPALIVLILAALVGCEGSDIEYNYPRSGPGGKPTYEKQESIFGDGGLTLFENKGAKLESGGEGGGIGVNSFLWRASLDTVSFMPLQSADPFGGVIITDWYAPPEAAEERFKVNIFILDRALRSDGVRAKVFKQRRASNGGWIDASADDQLDRQLEDAILTRARELRIQTVPKSN
jgi:hypothetical protein